MRLIVRYVTALVGLILPLSLSAQMEIESTNLESQIVASSFRDSIKIQQVHNNYFSLAQHRYERSLVRKERNKFDITTALQGSMTQLSESWIATSGGDNTVTLLATIYAKHTFTKGNFSVESSLSAIFGYYRLVLETTLDDSSIERDPVWYKNQDEIQLSVTPSYKFSNSWSYGATIKFRSQFANGYLSNASQNEYNLTSSFLSPGYLDISGGLIYKKPDSKLPTVTLSPIAMSATYVINETVRNNSQYKYLEQTDSNYSYTEPYGVNHELTSNYEGGSSVQIDYERSFGKNSFLKYVTSLYTFYGWMKQLTYQNMYGKIDVYETALEEWNNTNDGVKPLLSLRPTVRWENRIEIKAHRLLTTTINFQLYYIRAQSYKIQTQTLLSVGISYNFKR